MANLTNPNPHSEVEPEFKGNSGVLSSLRPRRWLLLVVVLVVAGVLLRAATGSGSSTFLSDLLPWVNPPTAVIYFPDTENRFLVPVSRTLKSELKSPVEVVEEYFEGPADTGRLSTGFELDVRLISAVQDSATMDVNIETGSSLPADGSENMAARALMESMRPFPEVEKVAIHRDGRVVATAQQSSSNRAGVIYRNFGEYLVPVASTATTPEEAVRLFLNNEAYSDPLSGFPADVDLIEYRYDRKPSVVYLELTYTESLRKLAVDDPDLIQRVLTGLIATATDFPEVKAVFLNFEGHTRLGLGQCSNMLRAPQIAPKSLNDEEKLSAV